MTIRQIPILAAAMAAMAGYSCQKEPSTDSLHRDFLVYTAYDTKADFTAVETYFIPDSILIIGNSNKATYWSDSNAQQIVAAVADEMRDAGFTRSTDKETADAGLQLSYVEQNTYYVGYDNPYWWGYYPYYWSPGYWGNWGGWHYPYYIQYAYTSGSLMIEMVALTAEEGAEKKLPVLWDAFIGGLLTSSQQVNRQHIVDAVEQAFEQSPYLDKRTR